jgi:hypothetical protein
MMADDFPYLGLSCGRLPAESAEDGRWSTSQLVRDCWKLSLVLGGVDLCPLLHSGVWPGPQVIVVEQMGH